MNVIDQVISGLAQTESISLAGLRATPMRNGYRGYFDAMPRILPRNSRARFSLNEPSR